MAVKILFLCVANSARSQLAEAVAKKILGDAFEVRSAGSAPSGYVHPTALEVLRERGFSVEGLHSKSIAALPSEFMENLNYVATLCKEEVCPVLRSPASQLRWTYSDPAKIEDLTARRQAFVQIIEGLSLQLIRFKSEAILR